MPPRQNYMRPNVQVLRRRRRRRTLRTFLAALIAVVGVLFAIWFGIDFMLVGGIEEVVRGATHHPTSAHQIAWGAVRIFFCETAFLIGAGAVVLAAAVAE